MTMTMTMTTMAAVAPDLTALRPGRGCHRHPRHSNGARRT
jgi:hypothetical protein